MIGSCVTPACRRPVANGLKGWVGGELELCYSSFSHPPTLQAHPDVFLDPRCVSGRLASLCDEGCGSRMMYAQRLCDRRRLCYRRQCVVLRTVRLGEQRRWSKRQWSHEFSHHFRVSRIIAERCRERRMVFSLKIVSPNKRRHVNSYDR